MINDTSVLKVTIVTSYYPPEITASSNFCKDVAIDLSTKFGVDVTVICGIPTRCVDKETTIHYARNPKERINRRLLIIRTGLEKGEGKNFYYRAFYHLYRSWCIYKKAKKIKTDVYWIASTPPSFGLFGALLAKKAKTIYDVQDIFTGQLIGSGKSKEKSLFINMLRKFERYTYNHNTHIRTISNDMANALKSNGVPDDKISIIYNWSDENEVSFIERTDNPMFDMLDISREGFYVCYAGNIGLLQNLATLVNASEIIQKKEPAIKFIIIGDGVWKPKMLDMIRDKGLKNIKVFPMQDVKYVSYIYNLADVGIVTIGKAVSKGSLPSKTWNIMSASRPIVCEADKGSELQRIICENKCGLCVVPDDCEGLADAILALYRDRSMLTNMGKNGRMYVENNITRKQSMKKIFECIMKVKTRGVYNAKK